MRSPRCGSDRPYVTIFEFCIWIAKSHSYDLNETSLVCQLIDRQAYCNSYRNRFSLFHPVVSNLHCVACDCSCNSSVMKL